MPPIPTPSNISSTSTSTASHLLSNDYNAHMSAQASTNYKEAFSLFDKRGTGRVPADELGDLLRACGQNPTLGEVAELQKGVGRECTFFFSFGFSQLVKRRQENAN
jgi:Ca2+-binding EF-hand superfamily protein